MSEIEKFRDSCNVSPDGTINIGDNDKIELNIGNETVELGGDQLRDLAKEAAMDHIKDDDQKAEEGEEEKLNDTINKVESITADATNNEFQKEQLVEKENQLKAKKDLEKLDKSIQKEAEKLKCIQAYMDREAKRQAKRVKETQRKEEITEIKREVETEVKNVKNVFHKKMSSLARDTERMKIDKMKKLTEYRLKITKLMVDQETRGKRSNCKQDREEIKIEYCNARFPQEWFENKFCRQKENFCGVCCDKEFNVRWAEDREKCLYECRLVNGMVVSNSEKLSSSNFGATVETIH